MERLTGLDAGFLYMETPTQHMHTLKVAVVDPTAVPGGYSFGRAKEELAARLHLLPPFRRRIVEVPFRLNHPLWLEDPDFDLDRHVRRAVLPSPGSQEQLDAFVSEVAATPLDRGRPLWEIWVVEGISGGCVGFVAKIHHCVADGVRAAELLNTVLGPDPAVAGPAPPDDDWHPETVPSSWSLLRSALVDLLRQVRVLPGLVGRTAGGLAAVTRRHRRARNVPAAPFAGPKLSFNGALTPHRVFVTTSIPFAEVNSIRQALDVSVNDVVLAVCAGALRSYLHERGELPDRPLVVGVPVSTRTSDRPVAANSVSNLFATLPVHLDDPLARVRVVRGSMIAAKEQHDALGPNTLADWSELTPPRPFAAFVRAYSRWRLADRHRPPINLVASNVPGPRQPLYISGGRLVSLYSVGPILENIGLNLTVWSYVDDMNFGILAVPEHLPDVGRLRAHIPAALAELRAAAQPELRGPAQAVSRPPGGSQRYPRRVW